MQIFQFLRKSPNPKYALRGLTSFLSTLTAVAMLALFIPISANGVERVSHNFYSCSVEVPNEDGPVRIDQFVLADIQVNPLALWQTFVNLGAGTARELYVTEYTKLGCDDCFKAELRLFDSEDESVQNSFFNIVTFKEGDAVKADISYKMNYGGPTQWTPFGYDSANCVRL